MRFMFLTAMDQEIDIVMGYEAGADDYVVKPFSLAVLISKIHAVFARMDVKEEKIESGKVCVHKTEMKVMVSGKREALPKMNGNCCFCLSPIQGRCFPKASF